MIKMILNAIKFSLIQFRNTHPAYDGMIRYDFGIENERENLMILCFSHLSDARFILTSLLIWLIGPISFLSLQPLWNALGDTGLSISTTLFDGRFSMMATAFIVAFVFQWILRWTTLFICLPFLFLNQGDLHLNLATAFILGVLYSRACLMWWMRIELVSRTRRVWSWWSSLQWGMATVILLMGLYFLDLMYAAGFFAGGLRTNRSEFLLTLLMASTALQLLVSSVWGHFYYQQKLDPSYVRTRFSTVTWLLRIQLAPVTKNQLKSVVISSQGNLAESKRQHKELKDQSLGLGLNMNKFGSIIESESNYLSLATARLTVE